MRHDKVRLPQPGYPLVMVAKYHVAEDHFVAVRQLCSLPQIVRPRKTVKSPRQRVRYWYVGNALAVPGRGDERLVGERKDIRTQCFGKVGYRYCGTAPYVGVVQCHAE
jgi:hypothetical protein